MSKGVNLLLVEDDPVTCEVLSLMLADDGWHVSTADCGETALAHLQRAASLPALVLCDQRLPGLRGPELAASIQTFYTHASAPALALLAMSATPGPVPDGYDALLLKPFSAADLRVALESGGTPVPINTSEDTLDAEAKKLENLPVLDGDVVSKLQTSMGSSRVRELYNFALNDAAQRIGRMKAAFASRDAATLASEAHMLKGAAGMVGARRLASLAQDFETPVLAHSETAGPSAAKMAMLTAALDDIERMLETQFPAQS